MKKPLLGLGGALLLLIIIVIVIGLLLPNSYQLERRISVDAPRQAVLPLLFDLKRWPQWQGGERDVTLGAIHAGRGASLSWRTADNSGELLLTRVDGKGIAYDFSRNDGQLTGSVEIQLQAQGERTELIWTQHAHADTPVFAGYHMLGVEDETTAQLEHALNQLKSAAEAQ